MENINLIPLTHHSKRIKALNVKGKTTKFSEENWKEYLRDVKECKTFFNGTQKIQNINENIGKLSHIEI